MKKTLDIKKLAIKKLSITDLTKITGGFPPPLQAVAPASGATASG